jgi:predicted aldo/keto reductase-like oxidoreductase
MKKLGFGLMRLPLADAVDYKSVDFEAAAKMVDYFLEQGFSYFDTAYVYHMGNSEAAVKKTLARRHKRDSFLLADKMPTWLIHAPADFQRYFDEQLERCGVEYFDYYLLHNLGEKMYAEMEKQGGFEFLRKLKAEGRARNIGFSFHDKADVLDRILNDYPEVDFVQLQINYIDWDSVTIESGKCYETAVKHGKPVIVMEPVKGGALAKVPPEAEALFKARAPEKSAASWALRYAASLEAVCVVLSGMSAFDQLADNIAVMRDFTPLDGEDCRVIAGAKRVIESSIAVPCTACNYCVEGCPQNIPIPKYFALYNDQKRFGLTPNHAAYYMNLAQNHGKASACIACKQCEEHCPQHIAISGRMKEAAKVFDEGGK